MDEMDIFGLADESLLEDDGFQVAPVEEDADNKYTSEEDVDDDTDKKKDKDDVDEYIVAPVEDDEDDDSKDSSKAKAKVIDPKDNNTSNTISSFVNALVAEEILSLQEGKEVKTIEDLFDAIQEEKERYLNEQLESFPEAGYKEAFAAIRAGVPIEQVLNHQASIEIGRAHV